MSQWFIVKKDIFDGPHSAKALRKALREGELDPFTLVTNDIQSGNYRAIIDVTEIFNDPLNSSEEMADLARTIELDDDAMDQKILGILPDENSSAKGSKEEFFVPSYMQSDLENYGQIQFEKDVEKAKSDEQKKSSEISDFKMEDVEPLIKKESIDAAKNIAKEKTEQAIENISNFVTKYADKIVQINKQIDEPDTNHNLIVKLDNEEKSQLSQLRKKSEILLKKIGKGIRTSTIFKMKAKKKSSKKRKYFLLVKNKEYGPFSSNQVVHAYLKGKVDKKTLVRKRDEKKLFTVEQFTKMYLIMQKNKKNPKKSKSIDEIKKQVKTVDPSINFDAQQTMILQKHKDVTDKLGSYLIYMFAGIGLVVGGSFAYQTYFAGDEVVILQNRNSGLKNIKRKVSRTRVRTDSGNETTSRTMAKGEPQTSKVRSKPKTSRSKLSIPENLSKSARKNYYKPSRRGQPNGTERKPALAAKNPVRLGSLSRSAAAGSTIKAAKLHLKENKRVTLGPLFYDLGAVSSCAAKCKLTARDSTGVQIEVIFFKTGFQSKLMMKSGRASFTGIVKKRGSQLILQSIK